MIQLAKKGLKKTDVIAMAGLTTNYGIDGKEQADNT